MDIEIDIEDVPYQKDADDPNLSPIERDMIAALCQVYDPEIPVNIYDLGLIYALRYDEESGIANVVMTLTAPGCPVAGVMPQWIRQAIEMVEGVDECTVEICWDPPWRMEMMSVRARIELNMM